jgi:D-glycero-alpha-D-manno-heptose 1-phosphate guanylyltransferase
MECIVLAGGLGTRLRGTIGDYPKCMAEINGKPFLHYIFDYLEQQQCAHVILSLGYKHEVILDWLKTENRSFSVDHVIEEVPLGTGGGIQLAMHKAVTSNVAILNGDTMFRVSLEQQFSFHKANNAAATLALKPMRHFDRYGIVNMDNEGHITAFEEKKYCEQGSINGGAYIINKAAFLAKGLPEKFSFEKDYLEAFVNEGTFFGINNDAYFIDIGIPEDYNKAQEDFKTLFT